MKAVSIDRVAYRTMTGEKNWKSALCEPDELGAILSIAWLNKV